MADYHVLSIDGGGIRGIISVVLMQRLMAEPGLENWLDRTALYAGTSTGGLLALGLSHNLELDEIRSLYVEKGEKIFDDSWLDNLIDLGKLRGADYNINGLRSELKRLFGQTRLEQLKKRVLITAFDLDNEATDPKKRSWKPKIFHNFKGVDSDGKQLAWKVGLYTSAAPTYFPSVDGYIDGGVFAPNPSMCALAQTQDKRIKLNAPLSTIKLFSLGTGKSLVHVKGKRLNWGLAQWAKPIISLMMGGVSGIADYHCQQMLGAAYHRLAPSFPPGVNIPMDAVNEVPYMIDFAESVDLKPAIKWLKANWVSSENSGNPA